MKIVYIASSAIPSKSANSLHVMKMCQAFAKNGHEVILLVPDRKDDYESISTNIYSYYNVDNCFDIIHLPWLKIKGRGYIYALVAAIKAKLLNADIVFCRNLHGAFFSSFFKLNIMYEAHQPIEYHSNLEQKEFKYLIKKENFKKLVVITESLKKHFIGNFKELSSKVIVVPDAADEIDPTIIPQKLNIKDSRLQIGYTGSLFEGKGMELIAKIVPLCTWADFHIIGGDEESVNKWQNELNEFSNIKFYGFMTQKELVSYVLAFDILLLPNQKNVMIGKSDIGQWTSPLKLFEYMAARKPIISSDLEVLREILNEENAILVDCDDPRKWVGAIKQLQSPESREKLALKAYDNFVKYYTWEERTKCVIL